MHEGSQLAAGRPWQAHYPAGVRPEIPPLDHRNLGDLVAAASAEHAASPAFTTCLANGMHGSLSYAEVDRLSDAFAGYLRGHLGLRAGDRVAVQVPNCLAYPVTVFGILKAGCVLVNTNPLYTATEMTRQFADAEVSAVVGIDLFADRLAATLPGVGNPPVVLVRVTEFFPAYVAAIVRTVQRVWSRALPPVTFPHTRLPEALRLGAAADGDVAALRAGVGPESPAALQYTGGTTGVSKGAELTHGNLLANCAQMLEMAGPEIRRGQEVVLTALPLYHVFAFTVNLLGFYRMGGHNVLVPSPRPLGNLKRPLEHYPVTWISGVNTLFNGLLGEQWFLDHPPRHLRASVAGGMALHASVAERWERHTGRPVVEGYGLTETSPVLCFNPFGGARSGSIGIPVPSTDVACFDDDGRPVPAGTPGELCARGPQVMRGYWRRPDETAAVMRDGWLRTGDVAVADTDGFLRIVDRKKDLILVSGFNVYPNEVEECIAGHPGVREVAVVGEAVGYGGERVRAVVVRDDPALTAEQVRAWAAERLTAYKVPRVVDFADDLPKSPIGKILRKDVRREADAPADPSPPDPPPPGAPAAPEAAGSPS
ncbi:MAG: AMP-binding protein [Kineosporiaceae bacterium]